MIKPFFNPPPHPPPAGGPTVRPRHHRQGGLPHADRAGAAASGPGDETGGGPAVDVPGRVLEHPQVRHPPCNHPPCGSAGPKKSSLFLNKHPLHYSTLDVICIIYTVRFNECYLLF